MPTSKDETVLSRTVASTATLKLANLHSVDPFYTPLSRALVAKLRAAKDERKDLEAKLGTTPAALKELPDDVFGGLRYYREQVGAMADPTGSRAADVEKRAILERLLGEITVTPYPCKRELELEFGLGAAALPGVIPAGRANAYIVVAGAGFVCSMRPIALRRR